MYDISCIYIELVSSDDEPMVTSGEKSSDDFF